jgi:hypothetical protein
LLERSPHLAGDGERPDALEGGALHLLRDDPRQLRRSHVPALLLLLVVWAGVESQSDAGDHHGRLELPIVEGVDCVNIAVVAVEDVRRLHREAKLLNVHLLDMKREGAR